MKKNDKRKYLSPETEIVRFVDDIITTSDKYSEPDHGAFSDITDPNINVDPYN